MSSNSEARKRAEEQKADKDTVSSIQSMNREDLEKLAILSLKLLSEVQAYCHNIAELAPLTRNADSDPFNEGVAEGRRRQAINTLGVVDNFLSAMRNKLKNG